MPKRWVFTLNNWTNTELAEILDSGDHYQYLIAGRERGRTRSGTPHLQGFFILQQRKQLDQVKQLPGLSRCHFEVARGSDKQASDYCKKENDFEELGQLPETANLSSANRRWVVKYPSSKSSASSPKTESNNHPTKAKRVKRKLFVDGKCESSRGVVPTDEQKMIYSQLQPPTDTERIVRITAGAGSGKTTTILTVATKAGKMGHKHITYLTFSRAAASDGQRRIAETLSMMRNPPIVEARTLHAMAYNLLGEKRKEAGEEETEFLEESEFKVFIQSVLEKEIDDFLAIARQHIFINIRKEKTRKSMLQRAKQQVVYYIFKTLESFCRSFASLIPFKHAMFLPYYPAVKFHRKDGSGEKYGFPSDEYSTKVQKYVVMAYRVWEEATELGIRTHDLEMKRAQLQSLRIPGSLLLVDESQDLDACQMNWISSQVKHGVQIYLVGDAAQTIFGFRGAKSKFMMSVKAQSDFTLTKSWRFGANIANIANTVLFAKDKSPQTTENERNPTWRPYRVEGCGKEGMVTSDSILQKWRELPVTVIAVQNATLLLMAVQALGMSMSNFDDYDKNTAIESEAAPILPEMVDDIVKFSKISSKDDSKNNKPTKKSKPNVVSPEKVTQHSERLFPRIHINGKGEDSGFQKFTKMMKQLSSLYDLFMSEEYGCILPLTNFPEFLGERITWDYFVDEVSLRELNKYKASISVISTFREKTSQAIQLFREEVLDKNYTSDEADLVLSTCHSAKGMEWDNVQVCEDFFEVAKINKEGPITMKDSNTERKSWQFDTESYGDHVNVLYVAVTRAKKLLSIPSSIETLLRDCDRVHQLIRREKLYAVNDKSKEINFFGIDRTSTNLDSLKIYSGGPVLVQDALDIYEDIVLPLRQQYNLQTRETLMSTLMKPHTEDFERMDKVLEGDDSFEEFVESLKERQRRASEKQKMAKIFHALEEAKANPKERWCRPNKIDYAPYAPSGQAYCRECGQTIAVGARRVQVQVFQPKRSTYWGYNFHGECCPQDALRIIRQGRCCPDLRWDRPKKSLSAYLSQKDS